jgi:hypothetical protein
MFAYTDPTGTDLLQKHDALQPYRILLHTLYTQFARLPESAFTLLEGFAELPPDVEPVPTTVSWLAFPRTAAGSFGQIDARRFELQDEYVEWRVERGPGGAITRVTFTTEFPEYYQALAEISADAVVAGIREVSPGANPTTAELFGAGFDPQAASPAARAARFRERVQLNPWNNGEKGILCLAQGANTLGALFNLVGQCAVKRPALSPDAVCDAVGNACGSGRNSDPRVCEGAQGLALGGNGETLADPVGVRILKLEGIWKIDGQQVDINDPTRNRGAWLVTRNGRRAVLDVTTGVTMVDDPIRTGTQVSAALSVGVVVLSAPEGDLPEWARTGQEARVPA